jgi:ABC-2 type transport system permease protein
VLLHWAIESFSLTKYFPRIQSGAGLMAKPGPPRAAVDRVSLAIKPGELFGLLGPNGSGKTTFIKMLATLIIPSAGTARINGHDLVAADAVRSAITLANGDTRSFYWRLTGRQNLEFFAALYHLPRAGLDRRIREALELVGLEEVAETSVRAYSTGMKQRLALAQALLHHNPILLLDEPTRGLDPAATRRFHNLLQEELVGRRGQTVLLATHQLWEAEALCQRVAVMHQGRLQGCGSPSELRRDLGFTERWRLVLQNLTPNLKRRLDEAPLPLRITSQNGAPFGVEWNDTKPQITDEVVRLVSQERGQILSLSREQVSLETIFATLTQPGPNPAATHGQAPGTPSGRHQEASPRGPRVKSALRMAAKLRQTVAALKSWPRVAGAVLKRDFLDEWSYRLSFALRFLSIFFLVTMFYFLSRLIGQSLNPYLSPYGADYFSFVLVGLGFSQYFDVGLSTFSQSLREAQTTGTLEALLVSPSRISFIIISSCLWSFLLASLQVLCYLGLGTGLFKAGLGSFSIPALAVIILLTFVCFSSLGIIAAGFIMVHKRGDPVIWVFSTLSALLSGIYYPVAVLPGWLKQVAYLLPNTYALEAVRKVLLQGAALGAIKAELSILALFCAVLIPLSLLSFHRAVHRAKVDGSLTHY